MDPLDDPKYLAAHILWECGDCGKPLQTGSRKSHARSPHGKDVHDIIWLALDDVRVRVCYQCCLPNHPGAGHLCHWKLGKEFRVMERESAEGAYWVDWTGELPVIKIFDEQAPEGTQYLTILEAREEILYVAHNQIERWHAAARVARKVTLAEIEALE